MGSDLQILIIEDSASIRRGLRELLDPLNAKIEEAER